MTNTTNEAKKLLNKLNTSFNLGVTTEEIEALVKELNARKTPIINASEAGANLRQILSLVKRNDYEP